MKGFKMTDKKTNFDYSKEMRKILIKSYSSDKQDINQTNLVATLVKKEIETSEEITTINYDWLVEYTYQKANYEPKIKRSNSFEMRVTRGVRRALLDYQTYNPQTNTKKYIKHGKLNKDHVAGYTLNDKGVLQLPHNILFPTITKTETIDGKTVKYKGVKNDDSNLIDVPERRIVSDFGKCYVGSVKKRKTKMQGDKAKTLFQNALELSQEILKLNPIDVSETDAKSLIALENALTKFFELRSNQEGVEIETELKAVNH